MRQPVDRSRLNQFLLALGRRIRHPVRFYLVGGAAMIDLGLRDSTLDIDFVADADELRALDDLEAAIRHLKDQLDINVEPASPADFLPIPPTALDNSRFVRQVGSLSVYYYDLASMVIAKAARALERDLDDIHRLIRAGEVDWPAIEERWREIRASPRGWLRHEPKEVEARLDLLRRRLEATGD